MRECLYSFSTSSRAADNAYRPLRWRRPCAPDERPCVPWEDRFELFHQVGTAKAEELGGGQIQGFHAEGLVEGGKVLLGPQEARDRLQEGAQPCHGGVLLLSGNAKACQTDGEGHLGVRCPREAMFAEEKASRQEPSDSLVEVVGGLAHETRVD